MPRLISHDESADVRLWRWDKEAKRGNLNCREQQVTSDAFREGWERTFGKRNSVTTSKVRQD